MLRYRRCRVNGKSHSRAENRVPAYTMAVDSSTAAHKIALYRKMWWTWLMQLWNLVHGNYVQELELLQGAEGFYHMHNVTLCVEWISCVSVLMSFYHSNAFLPANMRSSLPYYAWLPRPCFSLVIFHMQGYKKRQREAAPLICSLTYSLKAGTAQKCFSSISRRRWTLWCVAWRQPTSYTY